MNSNGQTTTPLGTRRAEFERLFSRFHSRAYHFACRLTGNESDAEDLTQDAFVRAWRAFDRYDRQRSFEVWLLRIVSNLAIDRWRRQSTLKTQSLNQSFFTNGMEVQLGAVVPDHTLGPEEQCFSHLQKEHIVAALDTLPDAYRTAIILTDIEQWSYEEVAERMDCPVGTVRSRLHRGRHLLRQNLMMEKKDSSFALS